MIEGWRCEDYFILYSTKEVLEASIRYGIAEFLPEFSVLGLIGWDEFLVQDASGVIFKLPTVPCVAQYLERVQLPEAEELVPDSRFEGKIKWYPKPIVFGGDPDEGSNLVWVTHDEHPALVRWWNDMYRTVKASAS